MDKLLNFVAALEEHFEDYHVAVTPKAGEGYDFLVTCRQIYEIDSSVTHAFNLYKVDEFRDEFDKIDIRTGVNEDFPEAGSGMTASQPVDTGLGQHWVSFRVKV